jgi:hypothetical protein
MKTKTTMRTMGRMKLTTKTTKKPTMRETALPAIAVSP